MNDKSFNVVMGTIVLAIVAMTSAAVLAMVYIGQTQTTSTTVGQSVPVSVTPTAPPYYVNHPLEQSCFFKMTSPDESSFYAIVGIYGREASVLCRQMVEEYNSQLIIENAYDLGGNAVCSRQMDMGDWKDKIYVYSPNPEFAETFCAGFD